MLNEKIINCSSCNQLLKIPNKKQVAVRQIQCPKCGNSIIVSFLEESAGPTKTAPATDDSGDTIYGTLGENLKACIEFNGRKYPIEKDENIIGRQASTSHADIQLPTTDMTGNTVCTLRCADAKNGLAVNDMPVEERDEVVLLDGAKITMGRSVVIYRIEK